MLTFEELSHGDCRWPMAEFDRGEFLFCGEPMTRDGCAYCGEHMALAYKPHRVLRPPVTRLEAHESAWRELIAIAATAR
ncbi:MAG: GcrA family cell cycle regulator [Methylocella sp.]